MIPCKFTRYVIAELLKVFFLSLFALTWIILLGFVVREAVQQNLGWQSILRLIPYALPNALVYSLPVTLLFSICSVYGRLSANNELVAMKSVGISPWRIMRPALTMSILVSVLTVWTIDLAFSWGFLGIQRVVMDSVVEIVYGYLKAQRSYSTNAFSIVVSDVDGERLMNPTFVIHNSNNRTITISAKEATLKSLGKTGTIRLILTRGALETEDGKSLEFQGTIEYDAMVVPTKVNLQASNHPSHLPLRKISYAAKEQRSRVRMTEDELIADYTHGLLLSQPVLLDPVRTNLRNQARRQESDTLRRLEIEPHRRWASGLSCLAFVLVGLPLSVLLKNADFVSTFGICFLPILLAYYPIFAFGFDRAKNGGLPACSIWLGNVCCLAVGIYLFRRAIR